MDRKDEENATATAFELLGDVSGWDEAMMRMYMEDSTAVFTVKEAFDAVMAALNYR